MNDVQSFLSSKLGKLIIVLIVLLIVGYIAYIFYQKSIYNGLTKSDVEKAIEKTAANREISNIKLNDENLLKNLVPIKNVMNWYDENGNRVIIESDVSNTLNDLGIDIKYKTVFNNLIGKKLILKNYV